jgi:hypothetical protein
LRLDPLARCGIEGQRPHVIDRLFRGGSKTGIAERLGPGLAERLAAGGCPAALARRIPRRRRAWYRDDVETPRSAPAQPDGSCPGTWGDVAS